MDALIAKQLATALRENPEMARGLRGYLQGAHAQRHFQLENSQGEQAVVLRGRCQELTAIINELFGGFER